MRTSENISQNFSGIKEGDLTHKRHFLNLGQSTRHTWYGRRRFGV
ncbi:hypothetical protein [Gillisia hiemivivida]|nr:hypothetical protein [Gillisia hiemivivida]